MYKYKYSYYAEKNTTYSKVKYFINFIFLNATFESKITLYNFFLKANDKSLTLNAFKLLFIEGKKFNFHKF